MSKKKSLIVKLDWYLFRLDPLLYGGYLLIQLVWAAAPFISAYIINLLFTKLEQGQQPDYYLWLGIFLIANMVCIFFIRQAGIIDVLICFAAGKLIKYNIIKNIMELKREQISKRGEIIDVLNYDVSSMQYMLLTQIDLLCQCVVILINVIVLCKIHAGVSVGVILPVLGLSVVVWQLSEKYKERYSQERDTSIAFSNFLMESAHNREALQFFGNRQEIQAKFQLICRDRGKNKERKRRLSEFMTSSFTMLNYAGILCLLFTLSFLLDGTAISIGEITLFISFIGYGASLLQLLNEALYGVRAGEDSLARIAGEIECTSGQAIEKIAERQQELYQEKPEGIREVRFTEFRLSEEDESHTFCWKRGDMVVITGENGSGKSRLIKSILGYVPYQGSIEGIHKDAKIGYVSQEINLFDATVHQNITVFGEEDILASMQGTNLQEELNERTAQIGVNGKELSDGQRQRVAIARALLNSDGLLLLDDAFANLDKDNRKIIINNIADKQRIVVISSNDPNVIELGSMVIHMSHQCMNIVCSSNTDHA